MSVFLSIVVIRFLSIGAIKHKTNLLRTLGIRVGKISGGQ